MTTKAERGREVRERLVRAAVEVIVERGWAGATTRPVAERAGVAPSLVHYHYPSIQALLVEAALTAASGLTAGAGKLLAHARSADEAMTLLLKALDPYSGADPISVLLAEAYLAATRDHRLRRELAEILTSFRDVVAFQLSRHGVADPDATAAVLAAAIDGLLLHRSLLGPVAGEAAVLHRLAGGAR